MSDDFDKDDLFWLNDDDDETPEEDGFDPPAFEGSTGETDASQLGFTGELSWLGDEDDSGTPSGEGQRLGMTGELPWLQDDAPETPSGSSSRLGMTGELPWMQDDDESTGGSNDDTPSWLSADEDAAEEIPIADSAPSWLSDSETEPDHDAPIAAPDWLTHLDDDDAPVTADESPFEALTEEPDSFGVPDWLQNVDDDATAAEVADDLIASGPDWLNAPQTPAASQPPPAADVPAWLSGLEPEEEDDFVTADGSLSESWLSQGDQLAESAESDLTYDEWMAQQEAAERGPDLETEVPELGDFDHNLADGGGTGELPDWFLGMDELDTSDAPDWFTEKGAGTGELPSTDSLMDELFGTGELPADPVAPVEDAAPADAFGSTDDYDNFFAEFGDLSADSLAPVEDTAPADAFGSADDYDNFFAEFDDLSAPQSAEEEAPDEGFSFDFLSEDEFTDSLIPDVEPAEILDTGLLAELDAIGEDAPVPDMAQSDFTDESDFDALFDLEPDESAFDAFDDAPSMDDFGIESAETVATPAPDIAPLDAAFLDSLQEVAAPADGLHDDVSQDDLAILADLPPEDDGGFDDSFFTLGEDVIDSDTFPPINIDLPEAMSIDDDEESIDWFAPRGQTDEDDNSDWLDGLDELDDLPAMPTPFDLPVEDVAVDDIDALLASIDASPLALPQDVDMNTGDVDFDELLTDDSFDGFEMPRSPEEIQLEQDEMAAGLLSELGATIGTTSASAVVRQQKDRPVEELPDRLKKLRERADRLPAGDVSSSDALKEILPGIQQVLAPSRIVEFGTSAVANTVQLSENQRQQTDLLKSLVAMDDSPTSATPSAIDLTYTSSMLDDDDELFADMLREDDDAEAAVIAPAAIGAAYQKTRWQRLKKDRLLIAIALFALILLPFFVSSLRLGDLPPSQFVAGSPQEAVFNHLNAVNAGEWVLVAAEYGPTAAGELDASTQLILRHILSRGGVPVVVSTNPVSLLRVVTMVKDISPDLRENTDYYIIRYITANMIGLRDLYGNVSSVMQTDLYGQPTGLQVNSLDEFARIVIVAERSDDLRDWLEQIAPLTQTPILASIGLSAQPLSAPYVGAGIDGLLVGYRDAFTYAEMLKLPVDALELPPLPTREIIVPTLAPEAESTEEVPTLTQGQISAPQAVNVRSGPGANFSVITSLPPGATVNILGYDETGNWVNILLDDQTSAYVASNLLAATPMPAASATPVDVATSAPTVTDVPTEAPTEAPTQAPTEAVTEAATSAATDVPASVTPAPTQTPSASVTPSPTATPISTSITAVVISRERINARSGPDTTYSVVTSLNPGDTVNVKGRNGDGSWIEIVLEDGREAWVAAFLIEISVEQVPEGDQSAKPAPLSRLKTLAQESTPEAEATAEAESTEEAPAPAVTVPAVSAESPAIPYAEERWYAMTLGLVGIIIIILIGSVVNIARSILRRRA